MNAVAGFCHFCESHGPCVVFCTQVLNDEVVERKRSSETNNCSACISIGLGVSFITKDQYGNTFCSKQTPSTEDTEVLLKQACMRSLSCEVSSTKENTLVFFGDAVRGHVLSFSFQIDDTQARGLRRWFSFIILMRDKMFLLNLTPYLSQQMQETAKELQNLANIVFTKDQALCSQRALRLRTGKMDSKAPRSLVQLTGKKNIFAYLHTRFSLMLSSGSKIFSEVICDGLLPAQQREDATIFSNELKLQLRDLANFLGQNVFLSLVYCTLSGLQIIVRGDSEKCEHIVTSLETLLPKVPKQSEYTDYVPASESRLFYCKSNVAVPQPCSGICRIDILDDKPLIHWPGGIPSKWPSLMVKLIKAIRDNSLSQSVLSHHIEALKEEWIKSGMRCIFPKNGCSIRTESIASAFKCALKYSGGTQDKLAALKKSLGIKADDEVLLEFWMSKFIDDYIDKK